MQVSVAFIHATIYIYSDSVELKFLQRRRVRQVLNALSALGKLCQSQAKDPATETF